MYGEKLTFHQNFPVTFKYLHPSILIRVEKLGFIGIVYNGCLKYEDFPDFNL